MGGSFLSRLLVTAAFLLLSLFVWEGYLAWRRYVPAGPRMAAFERRNGWIVPLEPGSEGDLRLPRERFRGARFDVITPSWPLSVLAGSAPRARLVGLYVVGQSTELEQIPWSGGRDPLAEVLTSTRLVSAHVVPRLQVAAVDLTLEAAPPESLGVGWGDEGLQLYVLR